jgi:anti-sigma B factor antagonist
MDDRRLAQPLQRGFPVRPILVGFGINVFQTDGAAMVCVSGELDIATAPRLRDELLWLVKSGVRAVTVDLARLTFIDSTGLSVLVVAMKCLRHNGGDLELRSPNPATQHVFDLTGLTKVFTIS